MALASDLMAASLPASAAKKLGYDPSANFTAAGTTQGTATTLTSTLANVTTSVIGSGAIIGSGFDETFVYNVGPNVLTVYPPVGFTFMGQALNAGIQVASGSGVTAKAAGLNFAWNISGP